MFKACAVSLSVASAILACSSIFAQQTAICIDPPPINGAPAAATAPAGWSIGQNTPDIVAGNGAWPGFTDFTLSDFSGASPSGGTVGVFIGQSDVSYVETWQTTLTGLTVGLTYQVALNWQQVSGREDAPGTLAWSGGQFRIVVDGNPTDYVGTGTAATDTWQVAVKTFVATSTTAVLEIGKTPETGNGLVAADSGSACALAARRVSEVPLASSTALGVLALGVSVWGLYGLRRRDRNVK
jgi:hypothetical protein